MLRLKFATPHLLLALAFLSACNKVDDNTITTNIKAKMFSEPLLKSAAVNVTTKDGIVTISGTVSDDLLAPPRNVLPPKAKASSKSSIPPP